MTRSTAPEPDGTFEPTDALDDELHTVAAIFPPHTARQVMHATLAAARGAVRLEAVGMKHSSGRSVRKHYAVAYGLKPSTPAPAVIARIEQSLAALVAAAHLENNR